MFTRLPLDAPSLAERVLIGASHLKIEMVRFTEANGDCNVVASYEVGGNLRPEDEHGCDRALILALIAEFARPLEGGVQ